jgi:hypothetical protein
MNRTLTIFLIFISTLSFSQGNPETDIFRKIINHEIEKGITGIFIQCEKSKTFFDLKDFKEKIGLEVPENTLKEIEQNGVKSTDGTWNSELINSLNYGSDLIKSKKCLTKNDAELIFKKTKIRQNIISVSEPIFDDNYENCVVSVTYWKFNGSAFGHKCFLKNVYGVWTVIVEYEQWMT